MFRTMLAFCLVGLLGWANDSLRATEPFGFLKTERKAPNGKMRTETIPYVPREGDLVFFDDHNLIWSLLFAYVGTGPPLHMGLVVKKANGTLAVLEAGPDDTVWVTLQDLDKRLPQFRRDYHGTITIRACKKELTKEQSAALTKFAQAQDGKRYAVGRLLLQGTWFRSRGPFRELLLGKTYLDRDSWICSELAVAGGTVVKLFDPSIVHANSAYPLDLVNNERYDLSSVYRDAAEWEPDSAKNAKQKAQP